MKISYTVRKNNHTECHTTSHLYSKRIIGEKLKKKNENKKVS